VHSSHEGNPLKPDTAASRTLAPGAVT